MVKFEDIQRANQQINTMGIKGKEYAEVHQRIKAFRMVFPTGTIKTEIVSIADGICIMRAEVYGTGNFENETLLGTGTAYEKENSTFINKTSYIENCETSAVGRALGMAGFGIDVSVASYEEVANAIENQKVNGLDEEQLKDVYAKLLDMKVKPEKLCKKYGLNDVTEMNKDQYKDFCLGYEEWSEKDA